MVDTLQLFSTDFQVEELSKWSLHTIADRSTGEVREKEVCNTNLLSATIFGDRLIFHTSIPKLLYGSSLYEVKQSDAGRAVEALQKELRDNCGLKVGDGLKSFGLSRIDFCRNLQVDSYISDYIQALSELKYSRREKVQYKGETLSFRNTNRELCFYDKVKEVRSGKLTPELFEVVRDLPNNILRVETRLRKASVVKKEYSGLTVDQILSEKLSTAKLVKEFNGLTRSDSEQLQFNFQNNIELVEALREKRSRAVSKFFEVKGTTQFLSECGHNWNLVKEFLDQVCGKSSAYNWIRKLQQNSAIMRVERDKNLISEIKQKLSIRLVA